MTARAEVARRAGSRSTRTSPALARRVDELVAANRDSHVRRPLRDGGEEHEVAGLQIVAGDRASRARECSATVRGSSRRAREHVAHEAAAVESRRIAPAVPVRRAPQRQRRPDTL